MIRTCKGYNDTNNMGELQWGGHVGWFYALRSYWWAKFCGWKPNLVVCMATWQRDWFVMYYNL